jgi:hypothetical protein
MCLLSFAQFEREIIGNNTSPGLWNASDSVVVWDSNGATGIVNCGAA